jgi:hypothetical protein
MPPDIQNARPYPSGLQRECNGRERRYGNRNESDRAIRNPHQHGKNDECHREQKQRLALLFPAFVSAQRYRNDDREPDNEPLDDVQQRSAPPGPTMNSTATRIHGPSLFC